MSEKVYRIKALVFRQISDDSWAAESPFGMYFIVQRGSRFMFQSPDGPWNFCDSLSDGKARCEALCRERMERGLEVVDG